MHTGRGPTGTAAELTTASAVVRSVLVVDDDDALRHTIANYAKAVGLVAWEAANGIEALWVTKHQRPALVLVDLRMPRLDGYETIRHIRKFDPSIRIVVITGDLSDAARERVAGLGIDLLLKPFDLRALDALLTAPPPPRASETS